MTVHVVSCHQPEAKVLEEKFTDHFNVELRSAPGMPGDIEIVLQAMAFGPNWSDDIDIAAVHIDTVDELLDLLAWAKQCLKTRIAEGRTA
jgi:hypothetical protein